MIGKRKPKISGPGVRQPGLVSGKAISIALFIGVLAAAAIGYNLYHTSQADPRLTSYDDCMAQDGSFLLETFPPRCVYKEQTFTGPINQAEQKADGEQKFSVTGPKDWFEKKCAAGGAIENVMYAPEANELGACGSERLSRISFSYYPGEQITIPANDASLYRVYNREEISINGVTVIKVSVVMRATEFTADGARATMYYAYKNKANYIAQYVQGPTDQDHQKEFEAAVATWKF